MPHNPLWFAMPDLMSLPKRGKLFYCWIINKKQVLGKEPKAKVGQSKKLSLLFS
jgi:hypothetical protein